MSTFIIIANGTAKDTITLQKIEIKNQAHSSYKDEISALRIAHWLNKKVTGLRYHVEEKSKRFRQEKQSYLSKN